MDAAQPNNINQKVGLYSSLSLSLLTLVAFGFAMIAIPPSGPNCPGDCMSYPFEKILDYYPRDYYWMYVVVFQLFVYMIFTLSIHYNAPSGKKIFTAIATSFALISTAVLLIDYFIQFAVIPISLMKNETESIAILTQYNGHGIFIVLEELGYLLMSLAFLFMAPVFSEKNALDRSIRWLMILPILVTILSFIYYSVKFGLDRNYRFEVAIITINWLVIIIVGILLYIYFRRKIAVNANNTNTKK